MYTRLDETLPLIILSVLFDEAVASSVLDA